MYKIIIAKNIVIIILIIIKIDHLAEIKVNKKTENNYVL